MRRRAGPRIGGTCSAAWRGRREGRPEEDSGLQCARERVDCVRRGYELVRHGLFESQHCIHSSRTPKIPTSSGSSSGAGLTAAPTSSSPPPAPGRGRARRRPRVPYGRPRGWVCRRSAALSAGELVLEELPSVLLGTSSQLCRGNGELTYTSGETVEWTPVRTNAQEYRV
jgi:hypothetical protein